MWFSIAAGKKHKKAIYRRDFVAKRMTPDQIAEAEELAREWLEEYGE